MRRMYSQAELSAIIKEVFLEDVASGQIDLPELIEQALPEVDPSDLDFSGVDFVAKTLKQVEPELTINLAFAHTGFTIEQVYSKLIVANNVLYGVVNFRMTNNAEESKTLYQFGGSQNLVIPEQYGSKIFDRDGHAVSESITSDAIILNVPTSGNYLLNFANKTTANAASIYFTSDSGLIFTAGQTKFISARFFALLY